MASEPTEEQLAPHGREPDGTPRTPYGVTVKGLPRKSRRGATAGNVGNKSNPTPPAGRTRTSNAQRKSALIQLSDMFLVNGLVGLSHAPFLTGLIGEKQTAALAGDAVLASHFMPGIADGLILLSETKPGALDWLDSVEEKAPYLLLLKVGIEMGKAVVGNHMNPEPRLQRAGHVLVQMRAVQLAQAVEAEAEAMGMQFDFEQAARDDAEVDRDDAEQNAA